MPAARIQPQGLARINSGNPLTRGAHAIISAPQAFNAVSAKPLTIKGAQSKAVTPRGIALPFRKNFYAITEPLEAIGTRSFVEFWYGYPSSDIGASGGATEPSFATGSGNNLTGIATYLGAARVPATPTHWGAVYGWPGFNSAGEALAFGSLALLVVVRRQSGMEFWRDGNLIKTIAQSPISYPATTFLVGSFIDETFWRSSNDTILAGRIIAEWSATDVKSFCDNPWQLFEGMPRMLFAASAAADSGTGSAFGTSTVSGIGAATAASAANASGTSAAIAAGASTAASTAIASGTSTVAATGASIAAAVGAAAGTSTAEAVGAEGGSVASAAGSATGSSTASGIGAATAAGTGTASGASTASATGASTSAATGSAAGVATANGVSPTYVAGVGEATGTSVVDGRSPSTAAGVGSASGGSTVTGIAQDQATTFGGVPFFQSEHANKYRRKRREEITEAAERAVADAIATEVAPEATAKRPASEAVENAIARIALQIDVSAPKVKATRALKSELKRQEIPYEVMYAQQLEEQRNALLVQELQTLIQKDLDDQDEEEAMLLLM